MIELTKIGIPEAPKYESASEDEWKVDGGNTKSTFMGYTIKGELIFNPTVGDCLYVSRVERNGVEEQGIFTTSRITQIKKLDKNTSEIHTQNSIYKLCIIQ